MKRYATATIITLLVIAIALPVFGHGFEQRGGKEMSQQGFDGRRYAGNCYGVTTTLTAEQSKDLKVIRDKHLEEITPLRSELFAKRSELKLLWNKENPDGDKIKAKHREIDTIQNQLRDKMIDYRLKTNQIVPSDQRKGVCGSSNRRGFMGKNNYMQGGTGMGGMRW